MDEAVTIALRRGLRFFLAALGTISAVACIALNPVTAIFAGPGLVAVLLPVAVRMVLKIRQKVKDWKDNGDQSTKFWGSRRKAKFFHVLEHTELDKKKEKIYRCVRMLSSLVGLAASITFVCLNPVLAPLGALGIAATALPFVGNVLEIIYKKGKKKLREWRQKRKSEPVEQSY